MRLASQKFLFHGRCGRISRDSLLLTSAPPLLSAGLHTSFLYLPLPSMSLFYAALLGLIEGLTEFLPISSTGHLILAEKILAIPVTPFLDTFDIAIQIGAILAVVVLFFNRFWERPVMERLIVAFLPTGILGFFFAKLIKRYLLGNVSVVAWALLIGGVVLIAFERWYGKRRQAVVDAAIEVPAIEKMTYTQAFLVGVSQSLAMIPGVSRSGATIVGGLWLGLSRATIVEFSFLLAVPTMAVATAYSLYKEAPHFSSGDWSALVVGLSVSFVVAMGVIRWFLAFIRTRSFTAFGVYRVVIGVAVLAALFMR